MIIVIPTTTGMEEILPFSKNDFSKLAETREVYLIIYPQYLMIILIISNIYQNDQHHKRNPRI